MNDNQANVADAVRRDWLLKVGGDPADIPFWEGCDSGRFLLHQCGLCNRYYWPASRCIEHGDQAMSWVAASGRGCLYTYTIMHRAYSPAMKDKVPYIVGVVELEEGPYFHANIVDCETDEVAVGMPLTAEMTRHHTGQMLPVFKPLLNNN